jgi:sugar phosphate permease
VPSFASLIGPRFYYGWWVAFACAACILLTGGTFYYGFGLLVEPLEGEFGWSRAAVSVGFSLRTEVGGVAAPLVGILVDRIGARILMIIGTFIVGGGFILLGTVQSLAAFYAAIVLIAIGMSATNGGVPNVIVTHWFRRKRGRALGLMALGGGAPVSSLFSLPG